LLLTKLASREVAAAEQVFRTYEPYLRMVVRRQLSPELRAKFDSLDVVQSVWCHALKGFRESGWRFADAAHLRAFLVQLTRHRFIDSLRRHRRALGREQTLNDNEVSGQLLSQEPQPGDDLQADELWEELLGLCPAEHQEVLRLKREGKTTAEIADRTGLHEGSVRRVLGDLRRRLASRREDRPCPGGTP
jgi:RNA polymerase sigma-70 factor (ECF subfamily)